MKTLRSLFLALAALAAPPALAAEEPLLAFEAAPPAATHPSLYSFADLYRLALPGEAGGDPRFPTGATGIRAASARAPAAAFEPRFSVSAPHDPQRWALLLAGLAACAWVAHRRLTSPY